MQHVATKVPTPAFRQAMALRMARKVWRLQDAASRRPGDRYLTKKLKAALAKYNKWSAPLDAERDADSKENTES